jgi:predicted enzyme related to lactoylglutathione lyase
MVQDPQGGVSCPFKGAGEMPPEAMIPAANDFCWEELMSSDAKASVEFYKKLYGWQHKEMDMGPGGVYHVMGAGEKMVAGIMQTPAEAKGAPTYWYPYIEVDDVDGLTDKAASLGAQIHVPPRDIPDVGRFSILGDPVGATVALMKSIKE